MHQATKADTAAVSSVPERSWPIRCSSLLGTSLLAASGSGGCRESSKGQSGHLKLRKGKSQVPPRAYLGQRQLVRCPPAGPACYASKISAAPFITAAALESLFSRRHRS